MKRLLLLALLLILLLLALPINALLARRAAPPPWPGHVAALHSQAAANLDLVELAALDDAALAARGQHLWEDGASVVRIRVPWAMIQPQQDVWDWEALDRVLRAWEDWATRPRIMFVLDGSPAWARSPEDATNPYAPPQDVRDFGRFARELAGHVSQHIPQPPPDDWSVAFQVWHEPNIGPHWGNRYADPQGYFELLREASNNLRQVRPGSPILLASLAPTTTDDGFNVPDPVYLDRLLGLGAGEFFDFAAGQAYGFDQPPEAPPSPDQLNFRRVELLADVLVRHGLGDRPLFITAWGWWTPQASGLDPEASPWRSIPLEDLHDYQRRGWTWMRWHWPWAAAPAWVQYAPGSDEDPLRLGWVQRDARGQRTPAGEGVADLAHTGMIPGKGAISARQAAHAAMFPNEDWRYGPEAADPNGPGATFLLPFHGSALALQVQRGPYKGYFNIWVDDQPAPALPMDPATGNAYLFLYDPDNGTAIVPVARDLPQGDHLLRIEAQGGWGQWPLRRILIDDIPHPKPWPFWPVTAVLVIALGGVAWRFWKEVFRIPYSVVRSRPSAFRPLTSGFRALATWLPALGLIALPLYMRPVRLGPVGLPLHELLIWLGLGAAVGHGMLSHVQRPMSNVSPVADLRSPTSHLRRFLDLAVLLLLVIGFFAALNARFKGYAFYDWRVTFLTPAVFYLLITRFTLRRKRGVRLLGLAALLGGVLVSGIALGQFVTGHYGMAEGAPRVQALYGSANNLALVLGRVLPLAVALAFWPMSKKESHAKAQRRKERKEKHDRGVVASLREKRLPLLLALLMIAAAGFLTFSKGLLFISIPVGLLILFTFQKDLRKPILVLAGLAVLALVPFLNTPRLAQITSGTGRFRIYLWISAWRMWLDHPWLGVGPDNFLYAYRSFYVLPAAWEELNLSHPHNLVFDLLTRVGLLGFLAGMGLVLGTIWAGFHRLRTTITPEHPLRPWLLGLWAGFIAGMAHGLIDNSLFLPDLMVLSLLVTAVVAHGVQEDTAQPSPSS